MQSLSRALRIASLFVGCTSFQLHEPSTNKPHIVLVLADDLGYNDVGWNGGEIATPNLNKLMDSGVKFTEFHAHSVCTPSRASLLSGRYAFHTGLQHGFIPDGGANPLPRNITLIASHLKDRNYHTHMVGKWHLGHASYADVPLNRGFDTFYGFLGPGINYKTHEEAGFRDMWDGCKLDSSVDGNYSTDLFTDKAIDIIKQHDKSGGPMFLYLAYQAVHAVLVAPPGTDDQYHWIHNPPRKTLAKMVTHLDASIQKVVDALQEKGMWQNTFFVFTSDNGGPTWVGNSNWPYRGAKFTMWQGGHKVPAFMVHGGLIKANQTFDFLAHLMDLAPTFLGAAGATEREIANKGFDGENLWPVLSGASDPSTFDARYLVFNVDSVTDSDEYSGYAGIRNKTWKLTLGHPGEPSARCRPWNYSTESEEGDCTDMGRGTPDDVREPHLWNLIDDVSESTDVAAENEELVEELTKKLQPFLESAWQPLMPDVADDALLMASVAGGWSPWQACPDDTSCTCEDAEAIAAFEEAKNLRGRRMLLGMGVTELTRPPRTRD